jgi:cytoskeletal protein RodZ
MIFKISTRFAKLSMIMVAFLGLLLADERLACADASNAGTPNEASQSEASSVETNSRTSESTESESQRPEEQHPAATKKKPLKDFQPTEKIEADQAVDFPYDI